MATSSPERRGELFRSHCGSIQVALVSLKLNGKKNPLQKGLNLSERPSPLVHLLKLCLKLESVDPEEI